MVKNSDYKSERKLRFFLNQGYGVFWLSIIGSKLVENTDMITFGGCSRPPKLEEKKSSSTFTICGKKFTNFQH